MSKEAFLRRIIPAVASSRHGLTKPAVPDQRPERYAGVMAALVAVDHGFRIDGWPMFHQQLLHSVKNKVDFQAPAKDIGEYFCRKSVLDHGQITELPLIRYVGNVRQEHGARPVFAELTLQKIVRYGIRFQAFGHAPIGVRLPDRTDKVVFSHQSTDLLVVHPDAHPEKPHVDAHDTFVVSTEFVGFPDQEKVPQVLRLAQIRFLPAPAVVAGTGDARQGAQQLDT